MVIGKLLLVPHIGAQYNMDMLVSADMRHCVQEGLNKGNTKSLPGSDLLLTIYYEFQNKS